MKGRAFGGGEDPRKENTPRNRQQETEDLELSTDEDYSSSDEYRVLKTPVRMELSSNVYRVHEEITLEWPSQTVCVNHANNQLLVGSIPPRSTQPHITELTALPSLSAPKDIRKTRSVVADGEPNRIRASQQLVYAIADEALSRYTHNLEKVDTRSITGGYALSVMGDSVLYGNGPEIVLQQEDERGSEQQVRLSGPEVFSVAALSPSCAVGATQNLTLVDFRNGEIAELYTSKCDLNSVAHNGEHLVVFGNDRGVLTLLDTRARQVLETVRFHESPITNVAFSSPDTFASSSDCEVVLWDMSFVEEWKYHRYLSFVHQGQTYYKDFEFITPELLATTSADGLCLFSPQTELADELAE